MKAFITTFLMLIFLPFIWGLQVFVPARDLLEIGDILNIVIPVFTLPLMIGPVWKSLRGAFCDSYDRFIAAVFFLNLGIEIQMIWRLWDRVVGTSTDFRDGVIVYSLAMFALGGILQIMAFDGDRSITVKVTFFKVCIAGIISALASTVAIWATHFLARH